MGKVTLVRKELLIICGEMYEAMILNQFLFWSNHTHDHLKFIKEEVERMKSKDKSEPEYGWIFKSGMDILSELHLDGIVTDRTVYRKLDNLVESGLLLRRNNPRHRYDRVWQYRVDIRTLFDKAVTEGVVIEDLDYIHNDIRQCFPIRQNVRGLTNSTLDIRQKRRMTSDKLSNVIRQKRPCNTRIDRKSKKEQDREPVGSPVTADAVTKTLKDDRGGLGDKMLARYEKGTLNAGDVQRWWLYVNDMNDTGASKSFSMKEAGMSRHIIRWFRENDVKPDEFMEDVITKWKDIRARLGKDRLPETPSFKHMMFMKDDLLGLLRGKGKEHDRAFGKKEEVESITYTNVADVPKDDPRYEKICSQIKAFGSSTVRKTMTKKGE